MTKKILILIILVAIIVTFFLVFRKRESTKPSLNNGTTIVAFGDSLVQGIGASKNNDFVTVLSNMINEPIINMGISGNTTAQGLARIDTVTDINPKIVLLLLGGNDSLRKVPIDETFANLDKIISKFQEKDIAVILLGVRGGLLSDPYKDRFEKLAKEKNVLYVPDVLDGLFGNSKYMNDPIHPNDLGYQKIAEKVYEVMKDIK